MRKTISVTPDVWERWVAAAAYDGARQGRPVPVSEWIRVACGEKIERDQFLLKIPGDSSDD